MESNALKKAHQRMQELRAQGLLTRGEVLDPVEKAKRNSRSLKMAIRAMCWLCEGAGADPGVRQRVATCTIDNCPLWPHRPWQKSAGQVEGDQPADEEDEDFDESVAEPAPSTDEEVVAP